MSRAQHLLKRGTTYWFRFRVPADLRAAFGRGEVRRSLATSRYSEAKVRVSTCFVRISALCENARAMTNTQPEILKKLIAIQIAQLFNEVAQVDAAPSLASDALTTLVKQQLGPPPVSKPSVTVGVGVSKYLLSQSSDWAASTKHDVQLVLGWVCDHFGADTDLASISKMQALEFVEGLRKLESRSSANTFQARQTDDHAKRIAPRTVKKYRGFAQTFFNWTVEKLELTAKSPLTKITIKVQKTISRAATAATPEALENLLRSPLFQGHHPLYVHKAGPVVARGDFYWALLLQFYFGTRIGELAQLRVSDVAINAPIPYVHLRDVDDEGRRIGDKTFKNEHSKRKMPICDALIKLGFLQFVATRRGKNAPLFPQLAPSRGQKASSKASKFYSRYLERIGQKMVGKATHWHRHALVDALRAAGTQEYVICQITGHAHDAMHIQYGTLANLGTAKAALDEAKWMFDPMAVLMLSKSRWVR